MDFHNLFLIECYSSIFIGSFIKTKLLLYGIIGKYFMFSRQECVFRIFYECPFGLEFDLTLMVWLLDNLPSDSNRMLKYSTNILVY